MKDVPSTSIVQTEAENEPECQPESESPQQSKKRINMSRGARELRGWLNKSFRIEMTDGRVLIGVFLCTDRDANIILGSCSEYLPQTINGKPANEEPRMLGLVMIPGKHIVSIHIESNEGSPTVFDPLQQYVIAEDVM